MKIKNLLAATFIGISSPALSFAFETEEFCDFSAYKEKGLEVQFSPLGFNNKSVARKRFGKTDIYPHFFYDYKTNDPMLEKSIVHRDGVILDRDFYRVNEGSAENPLWVRYYTVHLEDCSKIFLRLDESSDEFLEYWGNRGSLRLSLDQFTDIHGTDIGIIKQAMVRDAQDLSGEYVTLTPLRGGNTWMEKISEDEFKEIAPRNNVRYMIEKIIKRPFVYRGIKLSNITLVLKDDKGKSRVIPGYLHGIVKWKNHSGKDIKLGVNESVLISKLGIPDKMVIQPVFKTYSGKIIVEDEVLKDRLDSGSGINVLDVSKGEKIGFMKRYEYKSSDNEAIEYLFDINGELVR